MRVAPPGPLPPRPDTIVPDEPPHRDTSYREAAQVSAPILDLRIRRRFSVPLAALGTLLLAVFGALPLWGYLTGNLHDEDGSQSSLLVLLPLLAFGALGGALLARAVRRAMWSTRVVLGPERIEIDDGGYRLPVTLEQLRSVSVEVAIWSGGRPIQCTVVAHDANGKRLVAADMLSPGEADHVGALLADHFALPRPTLVADIPPPRD